MGYDELPEKRYGVIDDMLDRGFTEWSDVQEKAEQDKESDWQRERREAVPHMPTHKLDGNQAAQYRNLKIRNPFTGRIDVFLGDQVYSVSQLGVVVAMSQQRCFYPWARIVEFMYHNDDTSARKVIQGY